MVDGWESSLPELVREGDRQAKHGEETETRNEREGATVCDQEGDRQAKHEEMGMHNEREGATVCDREGKGAHQSHLWSCWRPPMPVWVYGWSSV